MFAINDAILLKQNIFARTLQVNLTSHESLIWFMDGKNFLYCAVGTWCVVLLLYEHFKN